MSGLPNSGTPSWRRHSHARGLGRRCGLRSRSIWPPQHPRYAAVRGAVGSQATREGGQAANRPRNVALKRPHDPMPVTYTNRKDVTYTLYRATTATGRARDVFARQPRGPVEVLPARYTIREGVNGVVSLAHERPPVFSSDEVAAVEAAVRRHPEASLYRLKARRDHIAVHERLGPQADELAAIFGEVGLPAARLQDVVHLDVARADRPFGLNLLNIGLGWPRDRMVSNALRVFEMEFDHFWGPRMELVFRFALLLLVDANQRLVAAEPTGGRSRQWTILEVPRVLEDSDFRRALLAEVRDRQVLDWWRTFYDALDRRFQLEIINPVQTKTYKFAANLSARAIDGQSRSTIDPWAWVRDGALVVVDMAKEEVGADIAGLLGGTLVNLVALAIGQQAALPADQRRHVALLVDEFHALPAANYEAFLAELAKYGASLVLATQSLGALDTVDPQRGLRNTVFANVDHLFAFNCSAEDARALALELGAPIEPADLVELGDYQCYARLSSGGERLPAFHLRLDSPPVADTVVRDLVAAASGTRYGRDAAVVAD